MKYLKFLIFMLLLVVAGVGCQTDETVMNLFVYNEESASYQFQDVELETLHTVNRLEGEATTVLGGVVLEINFEENYIKWNQAPHSVAFNAFRHDGVLYPEDYDSLAMASIYYGIELTVDFYDGIGLPQEVVGSLPVYYLADITVFDYDGVKSTMVDNAFYMSVSAQEKGIFVVPFYNLQWVPMPLNSGILTHEYAHAVFDTVVKSPDAYGSLSESGLNFAYGLNEGCADYMAVARTGDANFMGHSTSEDTLFTTCNDPAIPKPVDRDASRIIVYSEDIDTPAREMPSEEFCPYDIGSFWASLMYGIAGEIDGEGAEVPSKQSLLKVATWLMEALSALGDDAMEEDFELWQVLSLFVSRIDSAAEKAAACSVIEDRYDLYFANVEGC